MPALSDCREILVFRALVLGDWLCATPALRALRAAAPDSRIVLCGLPWTAELARRLPSVDEFLEFPGHPELPERRAAPELLEAFSGQLRARGFDMALQLHGSGSIVNPLLAGWGAKTTLGFATPGTERGLDLAVPWPETGTEIERCLALVEAAGATRCGTHIDFPLDAADHESAAQLLSQAGIDGPYAVVHPGSQLPSRRWPPQRFAALCDALATRGLTVVITGSGAEQGLAQAVSQASHCRPIDLTGRTSSIWSLGALVASAELVVANDTGISHVAAALATPSVIVASGSDVARWAPLDHALHRVHWHATACRPCGHAVCPTAHECAMGVETGPVIQTAFHLLERSVPCQSKPVFAS